MKTLFEEAQAKMQEYIEKKEAVNKAMYEVKRAEYKAIEKFFLDHGIRVGYVHGYNDMVTVVKTKKAHCYDKIKEGHEGILMIYNAEGGRFFHFNVVAFVPLTGKKTLNKMHRYTYTSAFDFKEGEEPHSTEEFLEHILGDFEITDKIYTEED